MTDITKAATKLIDCVEFDMNGAGGKGGNGGLLSDTTLRAAHDLRVIIHREVEREQKQPRNGRQDSTIKAISRALLGKIVDEVFGGAIEDARVIEEIYSVIKREESALSAEEPYAAVTTDYLGCEYLSCDVAAIEKIAASGSKGPTSVIYLYAAPPSVAVVSNAQPKGEVSK